MDNAKVIWDYLKSKGLNDFAVAGIMGNLFAESGLNPHNLQNSYENSLGMNDDAYVAAVDNGTYTNFVHDSAGFGLAQWTYWSRKQNLLNFAKAAGVSIGDLQMQLDFFWKEIQGYTGVMSVLRSATSVLEASNAVLLNFERPASVGPNATPEQKENTCTKRTQMGQTYYKQIMTAPTSDVDLEQFTKLFQEMRNGLQDNDAGEWSENARQWAVNVGLIVGNGTTINDMPNYMWHDFLTREQLITVLYRFAQLIGNP